MLPTTPFMRYQFHNFMITHYYFPVIETLQTKKFLIIKEEVQDMYKEKLNF